MCAIKGANIILSNQTMEMIIFLITLLKVKRIYSAQYPDYLHFY